MKYFSTFSGIGGMEKGIEQAHELILNAMELGGRGQEKDIVEATLPNAVGESDERQRPACVGYSEIDKYAIQIYEQHFPNHRNFGDITKISPSDLPDFDLLVGGFPCQTFSIAGKRGGFDDTRGTMFFEVARIAREKQPRLLLLENVKGLLSHDEGRTFRTIISTLDELGYDLQWQVLNSKNHGVPQNRERVFIIGHLRGFSRPEVFPFGTVADETPELQGQVSNTLTTRYEGATATGTYVAEGELNAQVGTLRTHKDGQGFRATKTNLVPTIPARAREDGSGQPVVLQTPRGFNKGGEHKIAPPISSNSWDRNNHLAYTLKARADSGADQKHPKTLITEDSQIRRLTPVECERLQGFPDGWTEGVSDTQRYKCLGNAVTVNVIQDIMTHLLT